MTEQTPFQAAGYTKDTKFKVICGYGPFYEGDILVLEEDDNSNTPWFRKVGTDVTEYMNLPGGNHEELEVYEEQEESVEEATRQITRNTKINVELTVEEVIAAAQLLDCVEGEVTLHRVLVGRVGNKLDKCLEGLDLNLDQSYEYYDTNDFDLVAEEGSFEALLDVVVPLSTEKQNTLKEIEELRKKLAELEAKVEGMD